MSEITSPIMLDDTGQDLVAEAQNIVTKLQALINAVKPTAADIPLAPISGMTADDVQEGVAELKSNLSDLKIHHDSLSGTTDNSGRLFSNYDISNKLIIALLPTEHGKIADQVRLTGNTLCIKYLNSDSMSPYNNQSVTCNFYYVSTDLIVEDN